MTQCAMGRNKGCVLATRLHCARKPRSVTAGIHPGQRHAALVHAQAELCGAVRCGRFFLRAWMFRKFLDQNGLQRLSIKHCKLQK